MNIVCSAFYLGKVEQSSVNVPFVDAPFQGRFVLMHCTTEMPDRAQRENKFLYLAGRRGGFGFQTIRIY